MAQDLTPYAVEDSRTIATLGAEFTIMAECDCDHKRELHALFLRRQLGSRVTIGQAREKLRCHRCQARSPTIKVYRACDERYAAGNIWTQPCTSNSN
jgi:hypothetical protein